MLKIKGWFKVGFWMFVARLTIYVAIFLVALVDTGAARADMNPVHNLKAVHNAL